MLASSRTTTTAEIEFNFFNRFKKERGFYVCYLITCGYVKLGLIITTYLHTVLDVVVVVARELGAIYKEYSWNPDLELSTVPRWPLVYGNHGVRFLTL